MAVAIRLLPFRRVEVFVNQKFIRKRITLRRIIKFLAFSSDSDFIFDNFKKYRSHLVIRQMAQRNTVKRKCNNSLFRVYCIYLLLLLNITPWCKTMNYLLPFKFFSVYNKYLFYIIFRRDTKSSYIRYKMFGYINTTFTMPR